MKTPRLSNEFMEKIMTDEVWKDLSDDFKWTEQTLEKYKDKVDWNEISDNREILWTPAMLEKFKHRLDWKKLSRTSDEALLDKANLEKFKDFWDWSELSDNSDLKLSYELIDKFIDRWDWKKLIDRYSDEIYSIEFLEKYQDRIPVSELQDSLLWTALVRLRRKELAYEIIS